MPILPTECLLDRPTKDLIYDTLLEGEVPCYGCPKSRECPESLEGNLEAAAVLMGEDMAVLAEGVEGIIKCPRCGSVATVQWATEPVQSRVAGIGAPERPGKRIWWCFEEQSAWPGGTRKCNWSNVKYAGKALT